MFLASEMFRWGIDRDYDANRLKILLTIQSRSHECANKGRQAEKDECALRGLQGEMHGFRLVRQWNWKSFLMAFGMGRNHVLGYCIIMSQNHDLFYFEHSMGKRIRSLFILPLGLVC